MPAALQTTTPRATLGLFDFLAARGVLHAARPALWEREDGAWRGRTHAEVFEAARDVAAWLADRGVRAGDHVALLGESGPRWAIAFLGLLRLGAVAVPLDPHLTALELERIVRHARPRRILASGAWRAAAERLVGAEHVLGFADPSAGRPLPAPPPPAARAGDVTVLTYTSGTTGEPKGVETTLGNLRFQVEALARATDIAPGECFLSILGLNHLLELTGGLLAVLAIGGQVAYADSLLPADLGAALEARGVTRIIAVPLFLDALRRRVEAQVAQRPRPARLACGVLARLTPLVPFALRRRLFAPLHARLGGRLRGFVVGGAPLERGTERFWRARGFEVLQGYGLTETSPVTTVNPPGAARVGSVGKALDGVELRVQPRPGAGALGEVLVRGPHVMRGYHRRPDLTAKVLDRDGWLHTGDLGWLDADGYLHLTGRISSRIALASGKKVQAEEVEEVLATCPSFEELCVLGAPGSRRGGEEVCVVLVPARPLDGAAARAEVARCAATLAPFKRPTDVHLHPGPLPRTATRKVRRAELTRWLVARRGARA
jgi:long-chain acyl-CoA synthetase